MADAQKRTGPAGNGTGSKKQLGGGSGSRVQAVGPHGVSTRRIYWAHEYIDRGTADRPIYGSIEWLTLPEDHADKVAACVVAAECWASQGDTLEEDLRREVEQLRREHKHREDEEYEANALAHREYAETLQSARPSFLARRQVQLDEAAPRPGDFSGRGGEGA